MNLYDNKEDYFKNIEELIRKAYTIAIDKELPAYSTVIFDLELIDVQKVR